MNDFDWNFVTSKKIHRFRDLTRFRLLWTTDSFWKKTELHEYVILRRQKY